MFDIENLVMSDVLACCKVQENWEQNLTACTDICIEPEILAMEAAAVRPQYPFQALPSIFHSLFATSEKSHQQQRRKFLTNSFKLGGTQRVP